MWKGLFSSNLINNYRKWCTSCLEELKIKGDEIYEPLIWSIKDIEFCDKHQVKLEDRCPKCDKKLQFLHRDYSVGHCQYCFTWLGSNYEKNTINLTEYQCFLINSFKSLLTNAPKINVLPTNLKIGAVLKKL
ncbi:TniQ family protein [Gottfriedia acidiceleris]|uniref:TniQ family protein n=1 Tax=Gottfriedia acidiceleris TaxID=371036 RepID=UPI003D1E2165